MPDAALVCRDSHRREALRRENASGGTRPRWNGIDFVECDVTTDKVGRANSPTLIQIFFLCAPPDTLNEDQLFLTCESTGERIPVRVPGPAEHNPAKVYPKQALRNGHSYKLTVRRSDIDPQFASYRFKVLMPDGITDVDPKPRDACPPRKFDEPQINYLARDYASFRQVLLDRLALIMPDWKERHVPDIGIALVELFAYVGDYLAYFQDAVGTEAYLGTARQRISVRRHARLVDYQLHEGCNARTFVCVEVAGNNPVRLHSDEVYLITEHPDDRLRLQPVLSPDDVRDLRPGSVQAFEIIPRQSRCARLNCHDIKNVIGLIAFIVGRATALAGFLANCLPTLLMQELLAFARVASTKPMQCLVERLTDALNAVTQQYCLWQHADLQGLVSSPFWARWAGRLGQRGRESECNIALLKGSLPQYFASPQDYSVELHSAHNAILFYTWDETECCLPIGTTKATLCDEPADEPGQAARQTAPDPCTVPNPKPMPPSGALASGDAGDANWSTFVLAHARTWKLQHLSPGDILIFQEILGPTTHNAADADPSHRQAVRLTRVQCTIDPVTGKRIVEIEWDEADALKFPLCISSIGTVERGCQHRNDVSVARGNVVLVDHGLTIDKHEWLGVVPTIASPRTCDTTICREEPPRELSRTQLFRPTLKESDLTFAASVATCDPASKLLVQKEHEAVPAVWVYGYPLANEPGGAVRDETVEPPTLLNSEDLDDPVRVLKRFADFDDSEQRRLEAMLPAEAAMSLQNWRQRPTATSADSATAEMLCEQGVFKDALSAAAMWHVQPHLLDSDRDDQHFVVEIDNERRAHLRFGDNELGRRPAPDTSFYASYRRGNGTAGNVGADKIKHLVFRCTRPSGIVGVTNPLAAIGGKDFESLDHAKMHAPHAFRKLERAITIDDYAALARREFPDKVQQARATMSWMGTWYEIAVAIDPTSKVTDPQALVREVELKLRRFRRIGHLLRVELPKYVPLHIEVTVCIEAGYLRAHVRRELLDRFSNRELLDGSKGFFHPDNFTFGDALYLSRLIAEAKQVPGVENLDVTRFERRGHDDQGEREAGVMSFGPLEIPRLDNDPLRPENGCLCLDMRGER